ncbi:MAG: hypothetical protein QXU98_02005 [Candidatus Parvarchaeota archaeon]
MLDEADVSTDILGSMLRTLGMDRKTTVDFMKSMIKDERYLTVNLIHIASISEGIISTTFGHNSTKEHPLQVQFSHLTWSNKQRFFPETLHKGIR